ncbi:MAG: hypothetical protein C4B55_00160 [Candidatus Methanophagaceae archaeon]|nr:MAG: hypothetical protein C4B55_00160 [Methanophagales archaeon]
MTKGGEAKRKTRGRKIFGTALVAAFVVGAVFATAVSAATAAERGAAGGGVVERGWSEWEYSKTVLVKENSGQTLTDYQVLLNLSGADFPAEAKLDGSDLRFVDAEEKEELSYWVEKFDAANETGRVWVKVLEIPADGEAELKMLFGNPSAESASNGSAVFELFDVSGIVAFWHFDEDSWSGTAGEQSFGAVWGVALSDPTTSEILSFDATYWNYEPRETETTKAKKSQVSLANEIKEAVEIGGKAAKRASSA